MKVCRSIEEWKETRQKLEGKGTIGLVTTMGALHEGHLHLIKEARKKHDHVVATIFVNPLQFGENEDYDRYPRTEQADMEEAEKAGVDILWIPEVKELYPAPPVVTLSVGEMAERLCGRGRPGHFDGVATVVMKFFQLIQPHAAYFGLKDAQQFAILQRMCADLHLDVDVVGCETVREPDGLALSSRNVFLSEEERQEAPSISRVLQEGSRRATTGETSLHEIVRWTKEKLASELTADIEYVELLTFPELKPIDDTHSAVGDYILAAAVHYAQARLIDNVIFSI